jgi:hypothetical protein
MAQTVSHQALSTEALIQSQASMCEICGTESSNGSGSSLSTWVLPSVAIYQHTILIHSFLHLVMALYRMYQEEFAVSEENMLLRLVYIYITTHAYIQS